MNKEKQFLINLEKNKLILLLKSTHYSYSLSYLRRGHIAEIHYENLMLPRILGQS